MKFILESKYIIPASSLDEIIAVEAIGYGSDRKYRITGEPTDIILVPDSNVMEGEEGEKVLANVLVKQIDDLKRDLAKEKLLNAKARAVTRILAEKRGVSKEEVEGFVNSKDYAFELTNATTDDVRKWIRAKAKRDLDMPPF